MKLVAVLVLSMWSVGSCQKDEPNGTGPVSSDAAVYLRAHDGQELKVRVELALDFEARRKGLMFRDSMPEDRGMLFVFPVQEEQSFWMKNTYIPLDMLFIDEELTIVGIIHEAQPRTTTSQTVGVESKYVLEVNGGYCRRHGVREGSKVRFEGVPAR